MLNHAWNELGRTFGRFLAYAAWSVEEIEVPLPAA